MKEFAKGQLNLNTIFLIIITALAGFGIKKLDEINTAIIQYGIRLSVVETKVGVIEATIYKH